MGSSYIKFGDRGAWAHDAVLEVFMSLVIDELSRMSAPPTWAQRWASELETTVRSHGTGTFLIELHRVAFDEDRVRYVRRLLECAYEHGKVLAAAQSHIEVGEYACDSGFFMNQARSLLDLLPGADAASPGESPSSVS